MLKNVFPEFDSSLETSNFNDQGFIKNPRRERERERETEERNRLRGEKMRENRSQNTSMSFCTQACLDA